MRKLKVIFILFAIFFIGHFLISDSNIFHIISNTTKNSINENSDDSSNSVNSNNTTNNSNNNNFVEILVNQDNLMESLSSITSTPRNYGSAGELNSSQYLSQKLSEYGYIVKLQDFPVYIQDVNSSINISQNTAYLNLNPYSSDILATGVNVIARHPNFDNTKKLYT